MVNAQIQTYFIFWLQYLLASKDCAMQLERTEMQLFQILHISYLLGQIALSFAEFKGG